MATDKSHKKIEDLGTNEPLPGEKLLDHEYDGIREADNPLPRWWIMLFVGSIIFAIVYVPVVHVFNILPQHQLQHNIASAARIQEQRQLELEASGVLDQDPVAAGHKYFKTFCISCHGSHAEGGIGPNLTDAFWVHSPYADSIRFVIANGVAAKGMPTWGPVLGDRKIKSLVAYVETLWQTPPPVAGKKSEGQEYDMSTIRQATPVPTDSTATKLATS